jgi:hypothetical protein
MSFNFYFVQSATKSLSSAVPSDLIENEGWELKKYTERFTAFKKYPNSPKAIGIGIVLKTLFINITTD